MRFDLLEERTYSLQSRVAFIAYLVNVDSANIVLVVLGAKAEVAVVESLLVKLSLKLNSHIYEPLLLTHLLSNVSHAARLASHFVKLDAQVQYFLCLCLVCLSHD